jgi:hypothetical protein
MDDNKLAGSLMILISTVYILWYLFVLRSVVRLSKTHSTFIFYCSMGICEIGYMLNLLWMGIDIFVDGSTLLQGSLTRIYSISWNFPIRPLKLHYPVLAINRLFAVCFPIKFRVIFTRKVNISICICIWFLETAEVAVWHSLYPSDAYITHNITMYAALWKNTTLYFSLPIQKYIDIHLYVVSVVTFSCYAVSVFVYVSSKLPQRAEFKLMAYSLIDR